MPIRSTGCATCRKRKIRCDETRPGCQRCATHGVRCPGYRVDQAGGVEFKDQTTVTVRRANDRYKTKAAGYAWNLKTSGNDTEFPDSNKRRYFPLTPASSIDSEEISEINPTLAVTPVSIRSPDTERTQLYNEFVSTYLPKVQAGAQNGHFSFFQNIALKRSDQPALQQSFDALSLVQMGSIYKDQGLVKQAVRQYGTALGSLAGSIGRGDYLHNDDVLAAVTVLATCELYEEIAKTGQGWAKHVQGSNQLVAARGPHSLNSELALLLYSNMRHGALLYALIARKAPFMATKEWRDVAFRTPRAVHDGSTLFYDISMQVPGLLERHDEINLDSPTALDEIDDLLTESSRLEIEMRKWFREWHARGNPGNRPLYELRPIDDFPTFTSLCSDRTFDHAFLFPDFLIAYLHSLYWMVMHFLRTNIQSLQKLRHKVSVDWYPDPEAVVPEDELLGYVLSLCKCFPFFTEPISSSTGHIGIFLPLRTSALYFTEHGHWRWLKWIGAVRNTVFTKGLVPPNVQHSRPREAGSNASSPDANSPTNS